MGRPGSLIVSHFHKPVKASAVCLQRWKQPPDGWNYILCPITTPGTLPCALKSKSYVNTVPQKELSMTACSVHNLGELAGGVVAAIAARVTGCWAIALCITYLFTFISSFAVLLNCLCLNPWVLLFPPFSFLSHSGESSVGWASGCMVLSYWLGLNHDKKVKEYSLLQNNLFFHKHPTERLYQIKQPYTVWKAWPPVLDYYNFSRRQDPFIASQIITCDSFIRNSKKRLHQAIVTL